MADNHLIIPSQTYPDNEGWLIVFERDGATRAYAPAQWAYSNHDGAPRPKSPWNEGDCRGGSPWPRLNLWLTLRAIKKQEREWVRMKRRRQRTQDTIQHLTGNHNRQVTGDRNTIN